MIYKFSESHNGLKVKGIKQKLCTFSKNILIKTFDLTQSLKVH